MKFSIFLLLFLYLTGCSLKRLTRNQASPQADIHIASGIPASDMPCVPIQTPHQSKQSELSIRENISSEAGSSFSSENFAKLGNIYNTYRQRTSRTSSGVWKLWFFHSGIRSAEPPTKNSEENWIKAEQKALRWIKASPKSPAPYISYSELLIGRAFDFRGDDVAKKVPPEAWKPFHENVELARRVLEESKDIASTDPHWYATMLDIANYQSWSREEVKNLLHEALAREPYYHGIYFNAASYLLPKWRGSFEEVKQFATDATNITRKCEGHSMYARIYWWAIDDNAEFIREIPDAGQIPVFSTTGQAATLSKESKVDWKNMSQGFEDIVARYPDAWNLTNYARFACLAEDKARSKALFDKLGSRLIEEASETYPQISFPHCQSYSREVR